ncbi:Gfo/Idh/MocA family protein [Jiangella alkaliphila]|uniref:Predicted dehydrogenase n=1 Tax=Jiangella alkaliphila TaxID=419479 RepID=A0A1H2LH46_9ACTN|nr:Gfo/Idh/MocA family oxidoreductase [Jiangella alkaliphila]SDU79901.1 Predicted dehydrogenase [Jiangella alkaliphila]
MTVYSVGIIGCGQIAGAHVDGFALTGRATVRAVYDIDAERARGKSEQWCAQVAESAEALVGSVDIVVIATPGFARLEYVKLAVDAGVHILCEKPMALDLDDAHAIEAMVRESRGVFMIAFNQRYEPAPATLQEIAASGRLGGIVSAWIRWHAPAPSQRWRNIEASGRWRLSFDLSGGRINEFSSHAVDWLLWVLREPESVYGRALHVTEGFALDDGHYATFNCESGPGLLDVARNAAVKPARSYGIVGHAGSVQLGDDGIWLTLIDAELIQVPVSAPPSKHDHLLDCIESGDRPKTRHPGRARHAASSSCVQPLGPQRRRRTHWLTSCHQCIGSPAEFAQHRRMLCHRCHDES